MRSRATPRATAVPIKIVVRYMSGSSPDVGCDPPRCRGRRGRQGSVPGALHEGDGDSRGRRHAGNMPEAAASASRRRPGSRGRRRRHDHRVRDADRGHDARGRAVAVRMDAPQLHTGRGRSHDRGGAKRVRRPDAPAGGRLSRRSHDSPPELPGRGGRRTGAGHHRSAAGALLARRGQAGRLHAPRTARGSSATSAGATCCARGSRLSCRTCGARSSTASARAGAQASRSGTRSPTSERALGPGAIAHRPHPGSDKGRARSCSRRPVWARTRSRSRRAIRPSSLPVARSTMGTRPMSAEAMRSARCPISSSV